MLREPILCTCRPRRVAGADKLRIMARTPANLRCPVCETVGQYDIVRERHAKTLERVYRCVACDREFKTVEEVRFGQPVAYIQLPTSTQPIRFDQSRIEAHLERHLRKLLQGHLRQRVAKRATLKFPDKMPQLHGERFIDGIPVLPAITIREIVQEVLGEEAARAEPAIRAQWQAAEAMYRLTQVDTEVIEFARWMKDYFSLHQALPGSQPGKRVKETERWVPPRSALVLPTTVVKNRRADDPAMSGAGIVQADESADYAATRERRAHLPFHEGQFLESITKAVGPEKHGQPIPTHELAREIAAWVLWSCDGQPVVRSSQLAAYTAGVLRRAAPVAYLRWTVLGKELRVRETPTRPFVSSLTPPFL